jgi:transcriptional regulator with XRE-family HTH domain
MKFRNLDGFFGYVIAYERKRLGLTQKALSQKLGVSQSALNFAEKGKWLAQPEWMDELAKLAGLPIEEMVARACINRIISL